MPSKHIGFFLCLLALTIGTSLADTPRYTMTDLGPGIASGLNNQGEIVGTTNAFGPDPHAVLWKNGRWLDLGPKYSRAYGINGKGQIVGVATGWGAVIWQDGRMMKIASPLRPGTQFRPQSSDQAFSINNLGQVTGSSMFTLTVPPPYPQRIDVFYGFRWQNGKTTLVGRMSLDSRPAINNKGQINLVAHISTEPGTRVNSITGTNDKGQIIGTITVGPQKVPARNTTIHAFLASPGRAKDIGTLGGKDSKADAINITGEVVST